MGFALSDMIIQRRMKNVKYILQIPHGGVDHNAYMMNGRVFYLSLSYVTMVKKLFRAAL